MKILLLFFIFVCCSPKVPKQAKSPIPVAEESDLGDHPTKSQKNNKTPATEKPREIRILADARARFAKDITIAPSVMIKGIDVPRISIKKDGADYVQILRCAAGYRFLTAMGQTLGEITPGYSARDDFRSAWDLALSRSTDCKMVAEYVLSNEYPDLAADSGDYYYVLNPCLDKTHTPSKRSECSYHLAVSSVFSYESQILKAYSEKTKALMKAQGELDALFGEFYFIVETFKSHLKACEDLLAQDRKMLSFKKGLLQLGLYAGLSAAGLIIGPNAAIMMGMMGSMIGTQILAGVMGWPPMIANVCLDPNFKGQAQAQDGSVYSVTPVYNRMIALLQTEIPESTKRLQAAQDVLSAELTEVISYDEMVQKASAKGVDLMAIPDEPINPLDALGDLSSLFN